MWQSLGVRPKCVRVSLFIGLEGRALKGVDAGEIYNFDAVKVISILLVAKAGANRTCAKSQVFLFRVCSGASGREALHRSTIGKETG